MALLLLALLAVLGSGLSHLLKAVLLLAVLVYGSRSVYRLLKPRFSALKLGADGLLLIEAGGEQRLPGHGKRCFVSPWFLGAGDRRVRLGVFCEQMAADDFRQLSVFLRQHSGA